MKHIILILVLASTVVTGCGGGNTSVEKKNLTGIFIDAPVKGLIYTANPSGKTGTTNTAGEFKYQEGDKVSFKMGTLELGTGEPDTEKKIKITQFPNTTLIGQLLQTLDLNTAEDEIDVSGIVIPNTIIQSIKAKLDKPSPQNIITSIELGEIKIKNSSLQITATEVKPLSDVVDHIISQTADNSLIFTTSELNNQFYISATALQNKLSGKVIRFDISKKSRWISSAPFPPIKPFNLYSKHPWRVKNGKLEVEFHTTNLCTFTKIDDNQSSVSVSISCTTGYKGFDHFYKSQAFSTNSLTGKTITLKGTGDNPNTPITFTFNSDGTYTSSAQNAINGTIYKDTSLKNTIWISFAPQAHEGVLAVLAEGSLTNGMLVAVGYDASGNYNGTSIFKTNGNIWTKTNVDPISQPTQTTLEALIHNKTYYAAVCDSYTKANGQTVINNHVNTLSFDDSGNLTFSWVESGQLKQGIITYSTSNEELTLNLPDDILVTIESVIDKGSYLELSKANETEKGKFYKSSNDAESELSNCSHSSTI